MAWSDEARRAAAAARKAKAGGSGKVAGTKPKSLTRQGYQAKTGLKPPHRTAGEYNVKQRKKAAYEQYVRATTDKTRGKVAGSTPTRRATSKLKARNRPS